MTVQQMMERFGWTAFALPDPEREVRGGYAGDLLSWVMGRAPADAAWLTIMSNRNIIAVAALTDCAAILLCEDVVPDEGVAELAMARGVNLLGTQESAFSQAAGLAGLLT